MNPWLDPICQTEFERLVREGAGSQDIHDARVSRGYAQISAGEDAFVAREQARVAAHQRALCALLEQTIGPSPSILDVGCGTGGAAVAMALSPRLAPKRVVGVDPSLLALRSADVRARGHGVASRMSFVQTIPDAPLPFHSDTFDLVVSVSVLEFIRTPARRARLIQEMIRVTRPAGHLFVATPTSFAWREHHTGRFLGNQIRRDGYPWATSPWQLRKMLSDCEFVPLQCYFLDAAKRRLGVPWAALPERAFGWLPWVLPWQKVLVRKRHSRHSWNARQSRQSRDGRRALPRHDEQ